MSNDQLFSIYNCISVVDSIFFFLFQLAKEEKLNIEKSDGKRAEVVDKFLATEKAITTKRENPFKADTEVAGPSTKKSKEEEIKDMNINTSM